MTLLEALEIRPLTDSFSSREMFLMCGFTPLHFQTFLAAYLRKSFPDSRIELKTGLYGDLVGNLERIDAADGSEACVLVEWSDLDQRLGIRSLGRWRAADIPDILESVRSQTDRLTRLVERLAESMPVYVSTPTLPLPPIFPTTGSRAQHGECELRVIAASLAASLAACPRVRVIAEQRVDEVSALAERFDPKGEISTGFPYSLKHASLLAELFATVIRDRPPKKGLIVDLDDTLWSGILGEVGVEGLTWHVARGSHQHGLFQRFLDSLASAGVLLAVASKNDSALVRSALQRSDLLLDRNKLFPVEANWGPKSASVQRILEQWNIGADDVVFLDDSPMEVAEVQSFFPNLECIVFPKTDASAVWELLRRLRDDFGKSDVSKDDDVRLDSIRTAAALKESMHGQETSTEEFLRKADAVVSFSITKDTGEKRALELINKTNQFSLNGRRLSESEWLSFLQSPEAFLLTASYQDRYGLLGKIAVLMGRAIGSKLYVNFWVMSCRAFSRRVEHHCLAYLFEKMGASEITFDYMPTLRNGPAQTFFTGLLGEPPRPNFSLRKADFDARVPACFHRMVEVAHA
jgi:FkbH-like protein